MKEKQKRVDEFIRDYSALQAQFMVLEKIENGLKDKENIEFYGELTVNGGTFPLHELLEGSTKELYSTFDEELSLFVSFLSSRKQEQLEALLSTIEIKEEEINEKNVSIPYDKSYMKDIIDNKIEEAPLNTVLNPSDLLDEFPESLQEKIYLSDIHLVFREYVSEGKMQILHYTPCYKCDAGYQHYYEKLPRNIVCGICNEDIVNIEIHYKKLY